MNKKINDNRVKNFLVEIILAGFFAFVLLAFSETIQAATPFFLGNDNPTGSGSFFAMAAGDSETFEEEDWADYSGILTDVDQDVTEDLDGGMSIFRGQMTSNSSYWGTVQQQYAPLLVAQSSTTTPAASVAPTLSGDTPSYSVSPATSGNTIAPPLTDLTAAPLNPTPASPAAEGETFFNEPVGTMKRFWDSFSVNYVYIPRGSKSSGLGINEFDLNGRFALPCKLIPHVNDNSASGYWYLAPSFKLNLWDGPEGTPKNRHNMPAKTFDTGLAVGMKPQLTKDFGLDVWAKIGIASSFQKITSKAIYIRGRAAGTLQINDQIKAIGGVIYYDRNRYKLLPTAGVEWRPNSDNIWYLVFPDPRLSRFLKKINETDWWGHIQGNIGGGRWLIKDEGRTFNVDYNDYRIGLGISFESPAKITGMFEVGGAFGRELYSDGAAWSKPKSMVYLKGGFAY